MSFIQRFSREMRTSAKWAVILFLPLIVVLFLLIGLSGGIEGDGKVLLLLSLAPTMLARKYMVDAQPVWAWAAVVSIEWLYFFAFVFLFPASPVESGVQASRGLARGQRFPTP